MLKELNDDRMKKQAQLRISMHQQADNPEADLLVHAAEAYMESVHILIEELKNQTRRMKQGEMV